MWLWALSACDGGGFADGSNVCGTIAYEADETPEADSVSILTIAAGHQACEADDDTGADTDGPWWDAVVAEPVPDVDRFEATVEPGDYAAEVIAGGGGYGGCAAFSVADASMCAAEPLVTVREIVSVDKPNLYLYPTAPSLVQVRLPAWKRITESAPAYPVDGWKVLADPRGHLHTAAGPRGYLFYELAWDEQRFQTDAGWCVSGDVAQATIEDAMADLGFDGRELDDFVEAWDADFPAADELTVFPQLDGLAELRIDPPPDTVLRAWFYVVEGCRATELPELHPTVRQGFVAAEWGVAFGTELEPGDLMVE